MSIQFNLCGLRRRENLFENYILTERLLRTEEYSQKYKTLFFSREQTYKINRPNRSLSLTSLETETCYLNNETIPFVIKKKMNILFRVICLDFSMI